MAGAMASKYESLAASALALVSRKGRLTAFSRQSAGTLDPVTDTVTGQQPIAGLLPAVGLPAGKSAEFRIGSLEGRNIMEFHVARSGSSFAPQPGDDVSWGGFTWRIFWTADYDPASDGAIYSLCYGER